MDEGIRIENVTAEITPASLEALLAKRGGQVRVTSIECHVSEAALNALLQKFAPGPAVPRAEIQQGALAVENPAEGGAYRLELGAGSLRIEIGADGLRVRTEPASGP